jgi:hypothetical protein
MKTRAVSETLDSKVILPRVMVQEDFIEYLYVLSHRLTWRNHIFAKRKQLGITLIKMYWLVGRQSKLTTSNKLVAYN